MTPNNLLYFTNHLGHRSAVKTSLVTEIEERKSKAGHVEVVIRRSSIDGRNAPDRIAAENFETITARLEGKTEFSGLHKLAPEACSCGTDCCDGGCCCHTPPLVADAVLSVGEGEPEIEESEDETEDLEDLDALEAATRPET